MLFRWFLVEKGFNAKALAIRLTSANWLPTVFWLANVSLAYKAVLYTVNALVVEDVVDIGRVLSAFTWLCLWLI